VELLGELVRAESHVSRPDGVAVVAAIMERELEAAGFACTRRGCLPPPESWLTEVMFPEGRPATLPPALVAHRDGPGPRVLIVGDLDTAHPPGSLLRNPFRVRDGRALGPGVADMKGGLAVLCLALRELGEGGPALTVVLSPDEQAGSLASRAIVEAEAARADCCLCLECAREGGKLLAARAQVGVARLELRGREAYAGADHGRGASAINALARVIPRIDALTDPGQGVYVTVTRVWGGRRRSVVPGSAGCVIDVRAPDAARWDGAVAAIRALGGELRAHAHRPAVPWSARLLAQAVAAGAELGLRLEAIRSPAAGSSAFAAGIPVLDGLGPAGGGLMTQQEYVEVDSLAERAALLARTLHRLADWTPTKETEPA
jgi:glutamate carboxypeptidase